LKLRSGYKCYVCHFHDLAAKSTQAYDESEIRTRSVSTIVGFQDRLDSRDSAVGVGMTDIHDLEQQKRHYSHSSDRAGYRVYFAESESRVSPRKMSAPSRDLGEDLVPPDLNESFVSSPMTANMKESSR
jgi:hypothetical protein